MSRDRLHESLRGARDLLREYDEDQLVDAPHETVGWFAEQLRELVEVADPTSTPPDPRVVEPGNYVVTWRIDEETTSPAEAAANVWRRSFRRGATQPGCDEACVFLVACGDEEVLVDLSEEQFAHLFDDEADEVPSH